MPQDEPGPRGGGMLGGLLAPLRLPERAIQALDSLALAARDLAPIRAELTRVREQTAPLAELLPELERIVGGLGTRIESLRELVLHLQSEESHLNVTVGGLVEELGDMHATIKGLRDDVGRVTDHLPTSRGPLQKARDMLSGDQD